MEDERNAPNQLKKITGSKEIDANRVQSCNEPGLEGWGNAFGETEGRRGPKGATDVVLLLGRVVLVLEWGRPVGLCCAV